MKYQLLLAILLLSAFAQDDILFTSDSTKVESSINQGEASEINLKSTLTVSQNSATTTEAQDSANVKTDYLRDGSSWVIVNNPTASSAAKGVASIPFWTIVLTSTVYTDCPKKIAVLHIIATGPFIVYINGVQVASGSGWIVYHFKIQLACGCNTIKVLINGWWGWGGAAYSVTQNTAGCYDCQNLGVSYYNKKTCQCQCVQKCPCKSAIYAWYDYPSCGCKCKYPVSCLKPKFFSWKSCKCECQPICCPKGYVQSPQSCLCVKQIGCKPPTFACPIGQYWDQIKCTCLQANCLQINCDKNMKLNTDTCQCEYNYPSITQRSIRPNNEPCTNICPPPFILKTDCTCGYQGTP